MNNEASTSAQRELVQMADRLSLEFTQVRSVSNLFYLDKNVSAFLKDYNSSSDDKAAQRHGADSMANKYNAALNNIYFQVALIARNGKVFGNPMFKNDIPYIFLEDKPWYSSFKNNQSEIIWTSDSTLDNMFSSPGYPYVYVIRKLHDLDTWDTIGTLIMGISELEIKKMYSGYVSSTQSTYIMDGKHHIISYIDNLGLGDDALQHFNNLENYSGSFVYSSGPRKVLVNYYTINATQWKIVTISDLNALLMGFSSIRNIFLLILALYLVATIILSYVLAKRFVVPINNLYTNMARVKNGDLDAHVAVTSNDEIAELSDQFNDMLTKIRDLMAHVVTEERLKREAEIMALQTQINPHFLYNTLASIRFMVYTGNKEDADTIILALIHLMKNTLSDANEFVTVEKEINLLQDYISIQKLAFVKPLNISIDIEEEINNCKIIKLLLQPIVENAILHGLKPKKDDCWLSITGRSVGSILEFKVADNGVGFDGSQINLNKKDPNHKNSIGLNNVYNRIVLTFGEQYGITVVSRINEGTCVTVRIPKIINEGGYSSYEHIDS
jgi:Predicted signal transduction protein with a C-terminal ATPase domain